MGPVDASVLDWSLNFMRCERLSSGGILCLGRVGGPHGKSTKEKIRGVARVTGGFFFCSLIRQEGERMKLIF